MTATQPVREVFDLTDPECNWIFNVSLDEARARVASGQLEKTRALDGHFALVGREGDIVRMARSLQVPLRYFLVKRQDGPALVVAHRIDVIRDWLERAGHGDQFHPSYTRMVPSHYITELRLVGCPDPHPVYRRFFTPPRNVLPADCEEIGRLYLRLLEQEIRRWLQRVPEKEPIGVCFSGGIDSGSVFLLTYHLMQSMGLNLGRLKAFTLVVEGGGEDLVQARQFLESLDLQLFLEPIEVSAEAIDLHEAVRVLEDYKPLDVQAGAMNLALLHGIRERYPEWTYLLDGDGGDENLKDYPIHENPELTIKSVLNNLMLYHEGWNVDSIKHSLTYSGGLSRGCTRGFAPACKYSFRLFSPYTLPEVIQCSEGIPFIEMTDWDEERLYGLKGKIVKAGVLAVTGMTMPTFAKRRFQHGAGPQGRLAELLPAGDHSYRQAFHALYES